MVLSARQAEVLRVLVAEYIHQGTPVASESVAQRSKLGVSPATIRNELAELEEGGYIVRPHTSAGAVPADKAYRYYVESLERLPVPDTESQEAIRQRFQQSLPSLEGWSKMAAQLLADLVRYMAIATPPRATETRWKRLDLVSVQEFLALLIMVLQGATLSQQLVPLREPASQDQLTQVANKLNATFGGCSRQEVEGQLAELSPLEGHLTGVAIEILRAEERERFPTYYVEGLRHIFSYPELAVGTRPRQVAELLEDRGLMYAVFGELPERGAVQVTIGSEHKAEPLRPFSVVFAQYGVPQEAIGVVGILGPRRMEYASAISLVRYVSTIMSGLVETVQGQPA